MSKSNSPPSGAEKRSAPRVSKAIDVVLLCPDKSGRSFVEKTQTLDISRTGAKTRIKHDVDQGARLRMAIPERKRMSSATIARVGSKAGKEQEIGIAMDERGDFWGVSIEDESKPPEGVGAISREPQTGLQAGAAATAVDRSRALAEKLLSSTERKPEILPLSPEQAPDALEQSLVAARQQLDAFATAIKQNLQEVIAQQTEERLHQVHQGVVAALQQLEAAARETTLRNEQVWEQRIRALTNSAQERLQRLLTEHEAQLEASAAKRRRELARRLGELSKALGED